LGRVRGDPDLLPLDRAGRLACDVEDDSVDFEKLVDHSRRDSLEQVVGETCPIGCHRIVAGHSSHDHHIAIRAFVALHALPAMNLDLTALCMNDANLKMALRLPTVPKGFSA